MKQQNVSWLCFGFRCIWVRFGLVVPIAELLLVAENVIFSDQIIWELRVCGEAVAGICQRAVKAGEGISEDTMEIGRISARWDERKGSAEVEKKNRR